jgi:predicted acyltransferase
MRKGQQPPEKKADVDNYTNLYKTVTVLFVSAIFLLLIGYVWSLDFPINKKIQSSSFVTVTAGLAIVTLSILIYLIEIKRKRGFWSAFFNVFGKNALFIYSLSELLPRLLRLIRIPIEGDNGQLSFTTPLEWFYRNVCAQIPGTPEIGSLVYAICIVWIYWGIGYWMDKKQIYLRV